MRMQWISVAALGSLLVLAIACGSSGSNGSATDGGAGGSETSTRRDSGTGAKHDAMPARDAPGVDDGPIGGDRPAILHVPPSYKPGTAMPLVVMLHGYSASGILEEYYLQLTPLSDSRGFLYAYPDGTPDALGNRFWNATDACCDFGEPKVDDSTYLIDLIEQISARYTVDPKRVFLFGHSNGAFMSYRMACDHGDRIAAIVSLAGAMWEDTSKCAAATPVSILEIHGTADTVILYDGGSITLTLEGGVVSGGTYPGAPTTVNDWVKFDGCSTTADTSSPNLDLDSVLPGAETNVTKFAKGCKPGGHAELWTIQGGMHLPSLSPSFSPDAIDFLFAHPKP
jgi:polyhydroxybutyrate depolymerase